MYYITKQTTTLLEVVLELFKGTSKQNAKNIIAYSTIKCDGKIIKNNPNQEIVVGQKIELIQNSKLTKPLVAPNRRNPVVIYYEDSWLIIAIKPVGLLSCANGTDASANFHKILEHYVSERDERKTLLWVVHRIDREVEGLIIFAKSEEIQTSLKNDWENVTKKYLALTSNRPSEDSGFIENWIRDSESQRVFQYQKEVENSKFAKTEYKYIKSINNYHLLEIILHTGRKNQIRVHLSGINCPIVGDRKYGADDLFVRQIRLLAYYIEFKHPMTFKTIKFEYQPQSKFFTPSKNFDEKYK